MHSGQYKRIYNVVFVLLALCTFVFVFRVSKNLIANAIFEAQENQRQQSMVFRQRPSYDDLVKQGKIEEAKRGEQLALDSLSVDRRIKFCEDNSGLLSTIATLLAYSATYFLLWFAATFIVGYIRKTPNALSL